MTGWIMKIFLDLLQVLVVKVSALLNTLLTPHSDWPKVVLFHTYDYTFYDICCHLLFEITQ